MELYTWAGRSKFKYSGSVALGTDIYFGKKFRYHQVVVHKKYQMLLNHFKGKSVKLGTSHTNPPNGSVGEWLLENVSPTALASYVGPILLYEGFANRIDDEPAMIQFLQTSPR